MSKETEDKIESFFRKAVNQPENITFRESDWQNMEKLLDEDPVTRSVPHSGYVKRGMIALTVVAITIIGFRLFTTSPFNTSESASSKFIYQEEASSLKNNRRAPTVNEGIKTETENQPTSTEAVVTPPSNTFPVDETPSVSSSESSSKRKEEIHYPSNADNKYFDQSSNEKKQQIAGVSDKGFSRKELIIDSKKSLTIDGNKKTALNRFEENTNPVKADVIEMQTAQVEENDLINSGDSGNGKSLAESNTQEDKNKITTSDKGSIPEDTKDQHLHTTLDISVDRDSSTIQSHVVWSDTADSVAARDSLDKQSVIELVKQEEIKKDSLEGKEKPTKKNLFRVALQIAPDFSSTNMIRYTVPGEAYGIQIGYYLTEKLIINSGIIKTTKRYIGAGNEYTPPEGYWQYTTNGIVPNEIKGECSVVEIPLSLQYNFMDTEKHKFYVSGGISSYIMQSENYEYKFKPENPGAAKGWDTSESSKYPFKVAHLSIGYQRYVNPNVFIGIEPYIKLPFQGIGWTQIKLMTTGAYVTVGYKWLKN